MTSMGSPKLTNIKVLINVEIHCLHLEKYQPPSWADALKISIKHENKVASVSLSLLDSQASIDKNVDIRGGNELLSIVTSLSYYCECQSKDSCIIASNDKCVELNTGTLAITATSEGACSETNPKSVLLAQTHFNLNDLVLVSLDKKSFHCIAFSSINEELEEHQCSGYVNTMITAKSLNSMKIVLGETLMSSISSLTTNSPDNNIDCTADGNMFVSPESSMIETTSSAPEWSRTNLIGSFQAVTETESLDDLLGCTHPPSKLIESVEHASIASDESRTDQSLSDSQTDRLAIMLKTKIELYEVLNNRLNSRLSYYETVHISNAAELEIINLHTVIEQQLGYIEHMGTMLRKCSHASPLEKRLVASAASDDYDMSPLFSTSQQRNPLISEMHLEVYVKELLRDSKDLSANVDISSDIPCTSSQCVTKRALDGLTCQRLKFALTNLWNVYARCKEKSAKLHKSQSESNSRAQTRMEAVRRHMEEPHELDEVISELITTKLKCAQLSELVEKQFLKITKLKAILDSENSGSASITSISKHKSRSFFRKLFHTKTNPPPATTPLPPSFSSEESMHDNDFNTASSCTYTGTPLSTPASSPTKPDLPPMQVMIDTHPLLIDDSSTGSSELHSLSGEPDPDHSIADKVNPFTPPKQQYHLRSPLINRIKTFHGESNFASESNNPVGITPSSPVKSPVKSPMAVLARSVKSLKRLIPPPLKKSISSKSPVVNEKSRDSSAGEISISEQVEQHLQQLQSSPRESAVPSTHMDIVSVLKEDISLTALEDAKSLSIHIPAPSPVPHHTDHSPDAKSLTVNTGVSESIPDQDSPLHDLPDLPFKLSPIKMEADIKVQMESPEDADIDKVDDEAEGSIFTHVMEDPVAEELLQLTEYLVQATITAGDAANSCNYIEDCDSQDPIDQLLKLMDDIIE